MKKMNWMVLWTAAVAAMGSPAMATPAEELAAAAQSNALDIPTPRCTPLAVASVSAQGHDGNVPENTLDRRLDTRWSHLGKGAWIDYDLGIVAKVGGVSVAWHEGNKRSNDFVVSTSNDGVHYKTAYSGQSSGTTVDAETYRFDRSGHRQTQPDAQLRVRRCRQRHQRDRPQQQRHPLPL